MGGEGRGTEVKTGETAPEALIGPSIHAFITISCAV